MLLNDTIVNILGTEYKVEFKPEDDVFSEMNCDGYTNDDEKLIVIRTNENFNDYHYGTVIRHEIVHAYMFESGLGFDWFHGNIVGHDETTIDWFARQFPKIYMTLVELGAVN